MPNSNPTIHNYLNESIDFNPNLTVIDVPHGVDTAVDFAHIPVFPPEFNFAGSFAIHAWIKADATSSIVGRIIQTPARGVNGVTTAFMLGLYADSGFYDTVHNGLRIGMSIDTATATRTYHTLRPVLRDNQWHHVVGQLINTGDAENIEIYVDGCLIEQIRQQLVDYSANTNTGGTDPSGLVVGWDANLEGPFKGAIGSLALFNRELTSEEIKTLAQGTVNLLGVSQNLKSSVVAWWKMGDKDPTGLATLNDSVGTNHLTTVNMDETNRLDDVPDERPREHQLLHLSTGCDEIQLDPNVVGCPFIWDSFRVLDGEDAFPLGWFGAKEATDKFNRVGERGRMGILTMFKASNANVMFITNASATAHSATASGSTIKFGNPQSRVVTDYCIEALLTDDTLGGNGTFYFGFINNPHAFANGVDPATGIYVKWISPSRSLTLIVSNSSTQKTVETISLPSQDVYGVLKLRFIYYEDFTNGVAIRVNATVNGGPTSTVAVHNGEAAYPADDTNADVFIGHYNPDGEGSPYQLKIGWVKVSSRGQNEDNPFQGGL